MAALLRFKVVYDGSFLDEEKETSPQLMVWSSMKGRTKEFFPVVWSNQASTLSTVIDVELPLPYDKETGIMRVALDDGIGIQAKACTPNPSGQLTLQNAGDARFPIGLELLKEDNDADALRDKMFGLPMYFHVFVDGDGNRVEKGHVKLYDVHAVDKDDNEKEVIISLSDDPMQELNEFSYVEQNEQFMSSVVQSMVARTVAMFTEEMAAAGLGFQPSSTEMKRVHAPFNQTAAGLLPGFTYLLRPGNAAPEPGTEQFVRVQQWMRLITLYALQRENMEESTFIRTVREQLRRTDNAYDDAFTECCSILGQMLSIPPTSMPYIGDEVYAPKQRVDKVHSKNGYPAFSKTTVHSVERFSEMCENDGGDCEDGGCFSCRIANTLSAGVWDDPLVSSMSDLCRQYVPTLNLGSVLSASLGNDVDDGKSSGHRGRTIDSEEDRDVEYGAHMWCEMVPVQKFGALVKRAVPDSEPGLLWPRFASRAPWAAAIPHLVVEATGRLDPLQLPRVSYVVNDDEDHSVRKAVVQREKDLVKLRKYMKMNTETFQYMSTVRRQTTLYDVPNERINGFYRNTTTMFTTAALERGLSNITFFAANKGPRVPAPDGDGENKMFEGSILSKKLRSPGADLPVARVEIDFVGSDEAPSVLISHETAERKLHADTLFDRCAASEPGSMNQQFQAMALSRSQAKEDKAFEQVLSIIDSNGQSPAREFVYGIPMYDKLQPVPLTATCFVPGTTITGREMRVVAAMMKQAPPITMPGDWEQIEKMHQAKFEARLNNGVDEAEREDTELRLFEKLRSKIQDLSNMGKTDPDGDYTHITFFFDLHLFKTDEIGRRIYDDVRNLISSRVVSRARLRFEEPMPHRRHACLQLICNIKMIP